jgi:hypothetical membrane protein
MPATFPERRRPPLGSPPAGSLLPSAYLRNRRLSGAVFWTGLPLVGTVLFTLGWIVADLVQPHHSARREYISSLAAGDAESPWIMVGAFLAFGVGVVVLGLRLVRGVSDGLAQLGGLSVMLVGGGVIVSGLARHDCNVQVAECAQRVEEGAVSGQHALHDVVSTAVFIFAGVSLLLIARSARRVDEWGTVRMPALAGGVATFVLFTMMNTSELVEWVGYLERALVLVAGCCVCLLTRHLHQRDRRPQLPTTLQAGMPEERRDDELWLAA